MKDTISHPVGSARPSLPRAFYTALLAVMLFAFGLTILIPILPLFITDELNASDRWIGTATLAVAMVAVTTRIPAGALSDRYGRRKLMLVGGALGVAASILYFFSHSIGVFVIARVVTGASLALFTTTSKALAADLAPPARRGEALGISNTAFTLGMAFSPLLGEGLKNAVGFRTVFLLSGLLSALAMAVTWTLPRGRPARDIPLGARSDLRDTLRERGTWAAILLMLGMAAILTLMFTFYPLLAERKDLFHDAPHLITSVAIGLGLGVWALSDGVVEPIAGWVSDRIGRQANTLPGLALAATGVWLLSQADQTLNTYAGIALMAAGWGIIRAMSDSLAQDAVPPVLRGMSAAVLYTSFDFAVGVDAQVLSTLIDGQDFSLYFTATMLLVVGFGVAGIMLATRLVSYEQRAAHAAPRPTSAD